MLPYFVSLSFRAAAATSSVDETAVLADQALRIIRVQRRRENKNDMFFLRSSRGAGHKPHPPAIADLTTSHYRSNGSEFLTREPPLD